MNCVLRHGVMLIAAAGALGEPTTAAAQSTLPGKGTRVLTAEPGSWGSDARSVTVSNFLSLLLLSVLPADEESMWET